MSFLSGRQSVHGLKSRVVTHLGEEPRSVNRSLGLLDSLGLRISARSSATNARTCGKMTAEAPAS